MTERTYNNENEVPLEESKNTGINDSRTRSDIKSVSDHVAESNYNRKSERFQMEVIQESELQNQSNDSGGNKLSPTFPQMAFEKANVIVEELDEEEIKKKRATKKNKMLVASTGNLLIDQDDYEQTMLEYQKGANRLKLSEHQKDKKKLYNEDLMHNQSSKRKVEKYDQNEVQQLMEGDLISKRRSPFYQN
jgi:hypothetical protein